MKLSDLTPKQWYDRLAAKTGRQRDKALDWWQYMDLDQPLIYVARILAEQDDRFPPLLLPWPELIVETVVERMKLEAFLLADENPVDELGTWWTANNMPEDSPEAWTAASVGGEHFFMVGPDGPAGMPMLTTEYADQVAVELDPRTRQPLAGLKLWKEEESDTSETTHGALYLPGWPGVTDRKFGLGTVYEFENGELVRFRRLEKWSAEIANDPSLPSVPFVPILTRPRRGVGCSDLKQAKHLVDGANQFATNLMGAGEHHAVGRKWIVGATASDFKDENGNQIPLWKVAMGDVWAIPNQPSKPNQSVPPTQVGQFAASDLRNFHESLKTLAQFVASKYGMPPAYMGYSSDNPPSAESILYSLERLILRTEAHHTWYGGSAQRSARLAWAIMGKDPKQLIGMESKWKSAAMPTIASAMDAAVKGVQGNIFDAEEAWDILGFSPQRQKRLRERMGLNRTTFVQTANDLRNLDVGGGAGVNPAVPSAPVPAL
ncbi:phage portal protein [Amycolatopsis circi]|uniref:phage portal protein n=1 Tax=Amycolatopsis circi TaxID=871959 RepID=UPI000E252DF2|nr:phage portal protein [Amycolatopsis circi]